jgi:curved DNA-binding protein CbpA
VRWLDERGAYFLLGVDTDATEASIKKRYHRLSLKAHPDKGGDAETFQKLTVHFEESFSESFFLFSHTHTFVSCCYCNSSNINALK